jgi:hypothetical protein
MRVNQTTTLGMFRGKLGEKNPPQYVRGKSSNKPKDPSLVPAPSLNIWDRPQYVPVPSANNRPGSDGHMAYKSRGV